MKRNCPICDELVLVRVRLFSKAAWKDLCKLDPTLKKNKKQEMCEVCYKELRVLLVEQDALKLANKKKLKVEEPQEDDIE